MDTLFTLCLIPIVVALVGGLLLLFIEYKSGFFAERSGLTEVSNASDQATKTFQSISRKIVQLSQAIFPKIDDARDKLSLKLVQLNYKTSGGNSLNLGETKIQICNVR